MDTDVLISLNVGMILAGIACLILTIRCCLRGKPCPTKCGIDGKTVLIARGDTADGIELARELSHRGGRVIIACYDVNIGYDIAIDIRGETNGEVIVEHVDARSIKSIRNFCTKILECESKIHILINNNVVQWVPREKTEEGFELNWGVNHLSNFVMTQLLLPLLHRGAPDARIINLTSSWYSQCKEINWEDPNLYSNKYSACEAFSQSKLANILFTRELSRRLEGTGINTYAVDPGHVRAGLGLHLLPGLGCAMASLAACCWLPWLQSPVNGIQTLVYCATDDRLQSQSGFYYRDCAVQITKEQAADMDAAYRLWEMSERMAALSS